MSTDEITREYGISAEDVVAALEFAADHVEGDQFHPLPTR